MSGHEPLTLCPPANIKFGLKASPEAVDFGDIYYSTDGGAEETRTVFHKACGLPERWNTNDSFTIGELGFGTGLNFLETLRLWTDSGFLNSGKTLHFVSIEKFPLDKEQLWKALKPWPGDLSLKMQLCKNWPGRVKGFHRLHFDNVTLTLIHDDVLPALSSVRGKIDAWFLDGFSPSKNPHMWSAEVMSEVVRLSKPGARLGTFTVARAVRDALETAGFTATKKAGFGRKRDRLEAVYPGDLQDLPSAPIKPVIIGGGIAGACLAKAFETRGIKSVIIDPDDDTAASGNPAAIIKPRLDLQDRPESRFFLSSYFYALARYQSLGCVMENTIIHACRDDKEKARYEKLLAQGVLPAGHFGKADNDHEYSFPEAIIIDPALAILNSTAGAKRVSGRAARAENGNVYDEAGRVLAEGSHVFWTCGYGIRSLVRFEALNLRYSRGQISFADITLNYAKTYGGYAIPFGPESLIGATHKRLDDISPFKPRREDDLENIEKFNLAFGAAPILSKRKSRSSVRVTTPSTLPLIFGDGPEWGLTGLGSRGFVFAPLLTEALAAEICGEILPVSKRLWTRFRAREKPNSETRPKRPLIKT